MYQLKRRISAFLLFFFLYQYSYSQFTVNSGASALEMAQELVGPGVEIISATYTGHNQASGIFTATNTSLPMENGVALSTGYVSNIAGPAGANRSTSLGHGGDAALNSLVGCHSCTYDAAILEFEFRAIGDEINFEFVFGSEEYPTYVCTQYNDVFAFFLSGPGITGEKNLALVPGTTVPVAINTINNKPAPGHECTKYGQGSPFPQYYIDNAGSSTIAYNGLTTVLIAEQEIQECEIYTIRLAIADVNDRLFDSGVFIKSNSFKSETPELSIDYDPDFPICRTDSVTFTATLEGVDPPIDYFWFLNWDMVGEDPTLTLSDLEEGDIIRLVVSADIDCSGTKLESEEIVVTFLPPNEVRIDTTICEGESYTFGGVTYTESIYGVYMVEPDPPNCDKKTVLNLTVDPADLTYFDDLGPFCQDEDAPDLPSSDLDGVTGTWSPEDIATDIPGVFTYVFTPDTGQCAQEYTMEIEIKAPDIPTFDPVDPMCQGSDPIDLPTKSLDNPIITGSWSPSPVNTENPGFTTYTFTPDAGQCADPTTLDIEVIEPETPSFDQIGPLCESENTPDLSIFSNNSPPIEGKWNPPHIDMTATGTQTYTFIPNPDECAEEITMDIEVLPEEEPSFDQLGPYCKGATPEDLPAASNEDPAITGTWSPAVINTDQAGTHKYTFTPDGDFCAEEIVMIIEVEAPEIPEFTQLGPFCQDETTPELPDTSENGISGTWDPAIIDTDTPGSHEYVFTPDSDECAEEYTMTVIIEKPIEPSFDPIEPLCQGSDPIDLPKESKDDPVITGTWLPNPVNTDNPGTTAYTFTPDADQCADITTLEIEVVEPITPIFDQIGPLCQNESAPDLPKISNNDPPIRGHWEPGDIDMTNPGTQTYTFYPDPDECAEEITMDIEILPELTPSFDQLGPYCKGEVPDDLPTASNEDPAITGTWEPAVIVTDQVGTHKYTFTPDGDFCAEEVVMLIEIETPEIPEFVQLGPFCQDETAPELLDTSENGINGTWNPAVIDTDTPGSHDYVFTPDSEECAEEYTMTVVIEKPIEPSFDPIDPLCQGSGPIDLPKESKDDPAITGTWLPNPINTDNPGTTTYTFTPEPGQCAIDRSIDIEIIAPETPKFDQIGPLCQNGEVPQLPNASNNTPPIRGSWTPSTIDVSNPGTQTYTFQPDPDECAESITMDIEVLPEETPSFDQLGPYCKDDIPEELPSNSLDDPAIKGTWSPATISTAIPGTFTYTFTPDEEYCAATVVMKIIIESPILPEFNQLGPYCREDIPDDLPTTSLNIPEISGTWSPAFITTDNPGTYSYTFTPDAEFCAEEYTMVIEVEQPKVPSFNPLESICQGSTPPDLPKFSLDVPPIAGEWSPDIIQTEEPGSTTYIFTPAGNQCALPTTMDIVIDPVITPIFDQIGPLCQSDNAPELPTNSINNPPISGAWIPAYIDLSITGMRTYTFFPNPDECAEPVKMDIEVIPEISLSFDQLGPYCKGALPDDLPTTSTVNPEITGTWSPQVIHTETPGTYSYVFSPNEEYCAADFVMLITIEDPIEPLFAPINPICQYEEGINLPTSSLDYPSITGTWDPAITNTDIVGTTIYTFTPNADECASPTILEVTVLDRATPTFEEMGPYCLGDSPTVLPTTSTDDPPISGEWNPPLINASQAGIYEYTFTPNQNYCAETVTIEVEVRDLPEITITPIEPLCKDSAAVELTAEPEGGFWSGTNVINNTFDPVSVGNFNVYYTYMDDNDCINLASYNIIVEDCSCLEPASADAGPDGSTCAGGIYTVSGHISGATSATWSTSGTGTFGDPSSLITDYTPSQEDIDNGSVTLTLTTEDPDDEGPCSPVSDQMKLTITGTTVNIQAVSPLCEDAAPVKLNGTPENGIWGGNGVDGSYFDPSVAGSGIHTITLALPDGCVGNDAIEIIVNPLPDVSIEAVDNLCLDDTPITLIGHPSGGTFSGIGVGGSKFIPESVGAFEVEYEFTDEEGCTNSTTIIIVVENCGCDEPATADAGQNTTVCQGESYTLNGSITNVDNATWTTSGTGTFDDAGRLDAIYTPSLEDYDNGSVTLILTTDDPDGDGPCEPVSDQITIVFENVNISIDPIDPVCVNESSLTLTAQPVGGNWSGPGVVNKTFHPVQAGPGTHTIRYTISTQCEFSDEFTITVHPLPEIELEPIVDICLDDAPIELVASPQGGVWIGDFIENGEFRPMEIGTQLVTYSYTDENGCKAEESMNIVVEDCDCELPASANAGEDTTICVSDTYTLHGSINNVDNATWTTSGTGTFDDAGKLDATYTPSQEDYGNGSVKLTLTTDDPDGDGPCSRATDAMTLSFVEVEIAIDSVDPMCEDAEVIELSAGPIGGTWSGSGVNNNTFDPSAAGAGNHTITYSIEGDCPGSETITIVVNSLPEIHIEPVDELCLDDDAIVLSASPQGGTWSGDLVVNGSFNPTEVGSHTVTYSYTDANGCSAEESIQITVSDCGCENPASANAGDDATICVSDTYTLSGSINNVDNATWTTSGTGTFDNAERLDATYTPSQEDYDNGSVRLTLTTDDPDGEGPCNPVSDAMTLTFESIEISINPQEALCADAGAVDLTASPEDETWSGPGVSGNSFNPVEAGPGIHTIKYEIDGQCPSSEEIEITVYELPEIEIEPIEGACVEEPIELSAIPVGGTWSGENLSGNVFTPMTSGNFVLEYSYTDGNGCQAKESITIVVEDCGCEDPASANAGDDATICVSDTYTLNGSINNVDNATWTTSGTGTFDDADRLDATYTPSQEDYDNGSVKLTLTTEDPDGEGPCRPASDAMTLTFEEVEIKIDSVNPLCEDADEIELSAIPTGGNWSGPGINGNTFDPSMAGVGSHTITYSVEGNCPGSETVTIMVNSLPEINIEPVDELCLDDNAIVLGASPQGGTWSGDLVENGSFNPTEVGSHTVTYTYTDVNGCSDEKSIVITVGDCGCEDPPSADAGEDATICASETYTLNGSLTNIDNATWTTSGTGTFNDASRLDATYTPSQEDYDNGSVKLTLTTDDPDGDGPCREAIDMMTLHLTSLMKVNLLARNADCDNPTGAVTILPPASDMYNFSIDNGSTFSNSTEFTDLIPGSYTLIYQDPASGCQSETDFVIKAAPDVDVNWKLTSQACSDVGSNYIDIFSVQNMSLPLDIFIDGELYETFTDLPIRVDDLELGEYQLAVADSKGCIVYDDFAITESSEINIDIERLHIINEGESVELIPEIDDSYSDISWMPPDYLSCTNCETPTSTPEENIIYQVVVTDEQGCADSVSVRIVIRKSLKIYIPEAFSPNGDGINDFFTIYTDSKIEKINKFEIFSRWGERLYVNYDFPPNVDEEGWDGTFRGQPMDPDVFMWSAEIEIPGEGVRVFRGDVTLVR